MPRPKDWWLFILSEAMLSLEECRKIEPATASLSDEELLQIRDDYAMVAQLAFDAWLKKSGSKNPEKVLPHQPQGV